MAQVRATQGFITRHGGQEVTIVAGDLLDADHDIVKNTPADWWEPAGSRTFVEEATAKPGTRRKATGTK